MQQQDEIMQQILGELKNINSRLDNIEQEVQELKQEIQELKQEVHEVKQEVQEVKHRIIVIENEHGEKLGAALDGYVQLYDFNKEIRADIKQIRAYQEGHSLRLYKLEHEA
ncbi:MAG: hypothetical protein FWE20_07895 [Defluviitaleaceae bacterium]|nr:hypothetical protein [Defluviitaleaceae bacterium]